MPPVKDFNKRIVWSELCFRKEKLGVGGDRRGDDLEVGRLRSETQAWRVGEEGGSERGVWDDAD